jgi:hypothetical protein
VKSDFSCGERIDSTPSPRAPQWVGRRIEPKQPLCDTDVGFESATSISHAATWWFLESHPVASRTRRASSIMSTPCPLPILTGV